MHFWMVVLFPFLLAFVPLSLALPGEDGYLVDDSFDGEGAWRNPSNWDVKDMPGYEISVDPSVSYEEGGKSLRLRSTVPGYSSGSEMWRLFEPTVTGTIEFRVKFAEVDRPAVSVEVWSTKGGRLLALSFGDGYIRYFGGKWGEGPRILPNRWYHVKIIFDCCHQPSYDLFVDGNPVALGVKVENSGIIDALVVSVNPNHISTSWFDSLRVYTDWPDVNPDLPSVILLTPAQYPKIVSSNDGVFIKAYVAGRRAPIKDVKLVWRTNPHWNMPGNHTMEMVREKGGIYSTRAPIPFNSAGETVYYRARAVDGEGNEGESEPLSYNIRYLPPRRLAKALILGLVIFPLFVMYRRKAGDEAEPE